MTGLRAIAGLLFATAACGGASAQHGAKAPPQASDAEDVAAVTRPCSMKAERLESDRAAWKVFVELVLVDVKDRGVEDTLASVAADRSAKLMRSMHALVAGEDDVLTSENSVAIGRGHDRFSVSASLHAPDDIRVDVAVDEQELKLSAADARATLLPFGRLDKTSDRKVVGVLTPYVITSQDDLQALFQCKTQRRDEAKARRAAKATPPR